jgi:mRNA deadenylase 3'-5' endonuclease subunit Ccr4
MNTNQMLDLSLMCWNILAPCWVEKEWHPSSYELASDYQTRINKILSIISSFNFDVIMIQEAQENFLHLFKQKLDEIYLFEFAPNNPTTSSFSNGLLTLINRNWKYSNEVKIINEILDPIKGDAIQIINIPSKNIYLINLHLDWIDPISQANMIKDKFNQLLGNSTSISIMGGDLNAEKHIYEKFQWFGYKNVFDESIKDNIIPSYYADPHVQDSNSSIDHIFYDRNQVTLIDCGKAFNDQNRCLYDALQMFGSDHIYVWANFSFISNKNN